MSKTQQEVINEFAVKNLGNSEFLEYHYKYKKAFNLSKPFVIAFLKAFANAERQNAIAEIKNCENKFLSKPINYELYKEGQIKGILLECKIQYKVYNKCLACQRDIKFYSLTKEELDGNNK